MKCHNCGAVINTGGRKKLNHSVNLLIDTLRHNSSVAGAAEELSCSRGYIYKVLKDNKMTMKKVMEKVSL